MSGFGGHDLNIDLNGDATFEYKIATVFGTGIDLADIDHGMM